MAKDWDAVATAIRARMTEIDMTQADLAARAGVALMTVRELQQNLTPRRRNPRTLSAVSEALGWPADQLARILDGQKAVDGRQRRPGSVGAGLAQDGPARDRAAA